MFLLSKKTLVSFTAIVLFSPLDGFFNTHFFAAAFADSEASSEAASEAPMIGGRGRRGYWRYQMQQQKLAAQQARQQQNMFAQQKRKQNAAGRQRNKPFRASDYIHEYGSGRSRGNFNRQSLSNSNASNSSGFSPAATQAAGGSISSGNLPSGSSVPFQKFPPK